MKTNKNVFLLLLSALLVFGMLLTGCPGEPEKEEGDPSTVELTLSPSGLRYASLQAWNDAPAAEKTLTVTLSEPKSASYQWYSRPAETGDGTEIGGQTSASFMPDITEEKDYFYYVIATVDGKNLSGAAKIQIGTVTPAPTQFKIGSDRLNYVRGVGGTGAFMFRAGNGDASPDADVEYVDLLMGKLGANILRIMVQDDYENYITNSVQSRNKEQFPHDAKANFFPVIKRVNELNGYVFANAWTAPGDLKTGTPPGNLTGQQGSALKANGPNYVDYAEHLRNFLKWLNDHDAPIFAIGILNEPDFGGTAGYEGMGMDGSTTTKWFKTVGNFTTQRVTNRQGLAIASGSNFADDIIPGWGGGKATHHVLAMSGDSMGDIAAYMTEQLDDSTANNYIELMGRHYYADSKRYEKVAGNPPHHASPTAWANRPQLGYTGPKETEALTASPQMYAPGSTAGSIKREVWQTEHDFNFGVSTIPPSNNGQNFWNCVFMALHDIDWCLRVNGESVYDWWYSSSFSGFVTGPSAASFPPHTITPRGRAFAHVARYVNETWLLPIKKEKGTIGNFNPTTYNAASTDPRISAFEDVNGEFITVVMYTPSSIGTSTLGSGIGGGTATQTDDPTSGSVNVGRIEIVLPDGFTATSASAIRSYGHANATGEAWDTVPTGAPRFWISEPVVLYKTGSNSAVEVTLPGGNIISIMVKGSWAGRDVLTGDKKRVRPFTVK